MKVGICSGVLKNLILKSYQTRLVTDEIFPTLSLFLGGVGWRAKLFSCLTRLMSMLSWAFDNNFDKFECLKGFN